MCSLSLQFDPETSVPSDRGLNYGSFAERKLSLLCRGLGQSTSQTQAAIRVFRLLSHSWWDLPLGPAPKWQTDITDDGSPFEFSIAFDGGAPKMRMLTEAQQAPMTLNSSWLAGLALNERLRQLPDVDLQRFDRVYNLFAPQPETRARCALWHAAILDANGSTTYKVYLNPHIRGPQFARSLVFEAFERLGMKTACDFFRTQGLGDQDRAPFLYFSLDISPLQQARVKVYLAHPCLRAEQVDSILDGACNYKSGDGERWIRQLLRTTGPFERRPILTCFSFTEGAGPATATLHLPIRDYTSNDASSLERACELLKPRDAEAFRRALRMFALRPLERGRSLLTYVSLRRLKDDVSVTSYIAPEAFAVTPARASWPPTM
jgi:DMATS type aromatic prenyltransferase